MSWLRVAFAAIVVCGLFAVWLIIRETGGQANRLVDRLLPDHSERSIEQTFREYLVAVRAAKGDQLLVAEVSAVEEISERDTRREFWTGLSLGTSEASIRYPVTCRYYIQLSDTWTLAVDGNSVWVQRPIIRPLEPAIDTRGIDYQGENGWLRWNKDEMRERLLHQLSADAAVRASQHAATAAPHADAAIAAFVRGWLLSASSTLPRAARVAVVPELPIGLTTIIISSTQKSP